MALLSPHALPDGSFRLREGVNGLMTLFHRSIPLYGRERYILARVFDDTKTCAKFAARPSHGFMIVYTFAGSCANLFFVDLSPGSQSQLRSSAPFAKSKIPIRSYHRSSLPYYCNFTIAANCYALRTLILHTLTRSYRKYTSSLVCPFLRQAHLRYFFW